MSRKPSRRSQTANFVLVTRLAVVVMLCLMLCVAPVGAQQQKPFTIEEVLAPAYPFELVAARRAERIAWIAYERGRRNVYTAAAPDFKPVRLTANLEDDGEDLTTLSLSDDGAIALFVRGHAANRDGWVANPSSDAQGAERAVWAVRTTGGKPWKVVVTTSAPVPSPDGQWVLYSRDGQIYRAAVNQLRGAAAENGKGDKPLFRAFGNNANPQWSPDGAKIAFVSNRNDHSFIGVYDLTRRNITYLAPSVDRDSSPAWSADGRRVAFIRRPGLPFGAQLQQQSGNSQLPGGGRNAPARRLEGEGNAEPPIKGLTQAAFKGGYTLSFWVADATTGAGREFWHNAPNDRLFTAINAIQWAGERVIFQAEPESWIRYYSVPVQSAATGLMTEPTRLTPGDGMAETASLSPDGKYLYYSTNAGDIDRRHLWKVATAGGAAAQLTPGDGIETYPAALASGERVALLNATAQQPQSVALVSAAGGKPRVIFPSLKEFPLAEHVTPANVTLTAADGLQFNNQLFLPKDLKAGERRPALVFVHGGPQRQMLLGYHYRHFYHMAYAINQYLANQGYIVLSVNYRSGIGYGKEFRNAERRGQRGNSEYQDVLAAGKYLQGRSDVDARRIGIWGLSYGGILTAQALARNSDIFAAGVDIAGVHLWGNSLDPKNVSYQSSAISQIDKWKSPVLLIHGDDDRNVAFSQTTGLVQLLRAHNIYHELIVFPDDVHDFLIHERWLKSFNAMDDFFRRFLKKNTDASR